MFVSTMSLGLDCLMCKDDPNYSITVTIHQCTDIYATAPTLSLHLICYSLIQVLGNKPELPECDDDDDEQADITNRRSAKLYMVSYLFIIRYAQQWSCFYSFLPHLRSSGFIYRTALILVYLQPMDKFLNGFSRYSR